MSTRKTTSPVDQQHVRFVRAGIKARVKGLKKIESPSFPKIAIKRMEIMNLTLECADSCTEEGDFATASALLSLAAKDAMFVHRHKREMKVRRVTDREPVEASS